MRGSLLFKKERSEPTQQLKKRRICVVHADILEVLKTMSVQCEWLSREWICRCVRKQRRLAFIEALYGHRSFVISEVTCVVLSSWIEKTF